MRGGPPSRTALEVARSLVYLDHDPEVSALLPQGAAEATERVLAAAGLLPSWMTRLVARPWLHRLGRALEAVTEAPVAHFGLRKRFHRRRGPRGARGPCTAGAGSAQGTTRCACVSPRRSPTGPSSRWTIRNRQAVKSAAIVRLGSPLGNLHLLAADLGAVELPEVLAGLAAWDVGARSVVVAEGLLMYLTEASVDAFVASVHRMTSAGTRLVFTWVQSDRAGHPDAGRRGQVMASILELAGEPWRWGVRDEGALTAFLRVRGFEFAQDGDRFALPARYLDDPERPWASEFMAVAVRASAAVAAQRRAIPASSA